MGKDEEKEGRLQENKVPNHAFFTEHDYLQRVSHINMVLNNMEQCQSAGHETCL